MTAKSGWIRRLMTSKREQGIVTPRQCDVIRARRERSTDAMKMSDDPAWWERFLNFVFQYQTDRYRRFVLRKRVHAQIQMQENRMTRASTAQIQAVRSAVMRKMLVTHRKA